MKPNKKYMLLQCIKSMMSRNKKIYTWNIETIGKNLGLMGSSATRYGREFCEKGIIKKINWHGYTQKN